MLGIKLNGIFLKIKLGKNSEGQIERYSPFFSIDQINAEFSTPITIPYTPENAMALGFTHQYYTVREKTRYTVEHYDNDSIRGKCTLVVETGILNLNNVEGTELSGYLLYGISAFFQDVKGKYLTDLLVGGVRTFTWSGSNPNDGSNGFWQHLHATWIDDTIPYVFAPVRNDKWYMDTEYLNGLGNDGKLKYDPVNNPVVPFIRLKYLIEQIFAEAGWTVDFSGLNDTEWEKLILLSIKNIEFYSKSYTVNPTTHRATPIYTPKPSISFSLNNYLPANKLISDFIVQLFGRYGWAPVFNMADKVCKLVAVKEARSGKKVDWTRFANPSLTSTFSNDPKIFAFTNEIDSNDEFPSAPDFNGKRFGAPVMTSRNLPAPTPAMEDMVRYCFLENQWIAPVLNDTTNEYEWAPFADNIYNEEPKGNTDTFSTTISTLPVYLTDYRVDGTTHYYAQLPMMKESKDKDFGFRTLLYHGMVWEMNAQGGVGQIKYPYASSLCNNPIDNNDRLTWSNVYRHISNKDLKDYGIISYWFSDFGKLLSSGEEVEAVLSLPVHELYAFTWDQIILIQQIPYMMKSMVEPLPYKGAVQATLKRMIAPIPDAPIVISDPTPPNGIYVGVKAVNIQYGGPIVFFFGWTAYQSCDVVVQLFADAAGTIPYIPTTPLEVYITGTPIQHNQIPSGNFVYTTQFNITGASQQIYTNVMYKGTQQDGTSYAGNWVVEPDPNNTYKVI